DWAGELGSQNKNSAAPSNSPQSQPATASSKNSAMTKGSPSQALQTVDTAKNNPDADPNDDIKSQLAEQLGDKLGDKLGEKGLEAGDLADKIISGELDGKGINTLFGNKAEEDPAKGEEMLQNALADVKDQNEIKGGSDLASLETKPLSGDPLKKAMKLINNT